MLSIAARTLKTNTIKRVATPLTTVRTKVTLPDLPYEYNVSQIRVYFMLTSKKGS